MFKIFLNFMRPLWKIKIHWQWWRLFRKDWYTGNRLKYPMFKDLKREYHVL